MIAMRESRLSGRRESGGEVRAGMGAAHAGVRCQSRKQTLPKDRG
jgi:hypothetical protein